MMRSALALLFSLLLWPASAQLSGGLMFPGPGSRSNGPSISYQTFSSSTANQTAYTFSSIAIGSAAPTRNVLVYVGGSNAGLAAPAVTVAGTSATLVTSVVDATGNATSALYIVSVPTGTTATIVVTWSAGQVRTSIATWATYNLASSTARATATSQAATANLNLNLLAGDVVVVAGESGTSTSASATGYASRFNTTDAEGEAYSGGDFTETANESPRTITTTWNGTTIFASLSASFR